MTNKPNKVASSSELDIIFLTYNIGSKLNLSNIILHYPATDQQK